jgi:RNA polymerase sigma-70 factor, ECF subfamily
VPTANDLERLSDEQLIRHVRQVPAEAEAGLQVLYARYTAKVTAWCRRICGDREEAGDLAQEVFLRVHQRLDSFRGDSRFSTWLYTVTRSVAINRGQQARRREADSLDDDGAPEPVETAPDAEEKVATGEILAAFRQAMARDLEPLEARVLYLHFVDGLPLAGITGMLGLENKSGAKALVVSGGRKLKRRFGKWLSRQSAGALA